MELIKALKVLEYVFSRRSNGIIIKALKVLEYSLLAIVSTCNLKAHKVQFLDSGEACMAFRLGKCRSNYDTRTIHKDSEQTKQNENRAKTQC